MRASFGSISAAFPSATVRDQFSIPFLAGESREGERRERVEGLLIPLLVPNNFSCSHLDFRYAQRNVAHTFSGLFCEMKNYLLRLAHFFQYRSLMAHS